MARTLYINRFGQGIRETVSEYTPIQKPVGNMGATVTLADRKTARAECREYQLSDPSANYYVSQRCCKDWKDK